MQSKGHIWYISRKKYPLTLVGVLLYMESRITVIYVIRSEEMLGKSYLGLTPLSSTCQARLTLLARPGSLWQKGECKHLHWVEQIQHVVCCGAAEVWLWKGPWRPHSLMLLNLVQGHNTLEKALAYPFVRFPFMNPAYFLACIQGKRHVCLTMSFSSLFHQPHANELWIMPGSLTSVTKTGPAHP